eukprot:maker-scaffold222_size251774-snap-gene-0.21 protein:Tk11435 transcript:maker-scaffold222_size251774-snap-gene-0.21-mRNA-1 annotation:"creg1 precursor"
MKTFPIALLLIALSPTLVWGLTDYKSIFNSIFSILVPQDEASTNISLPSTLDPGPPPHEAAARMARYVTHNSDWAAMATIADRDPIRGFPFANVFSISDGATAAESTGIPYLYLTPLDMSTHDLKANNQASLTMTLAQGQYCERKHYDPEDPRCAHIILTGTIVHVEPGTNEEEFAKNALFARHPEMPDWPKDHGWYFGKMNITNILVLDFFGGAKTVTVDASGMCPRRLGDLLLGQRAEDVVLLGDEAEPTSAPEVVGGVGVVKQPTVALVDRGARAPLVIGIVHVEHLLHLLQVLSQLPFQGLQDARRQTLEVVHPLDGVQEGSASQRLQLLLELNGLLQG